MIECECKINVCRDTNKWTEETGNGTNEKGKVDWMRTICHLSQPEQRQWRIDDAELTSLDKHNAVSLSAETTSSQNTKSISKHL